MNVSEAVDLKDENIVKQNPDCHILPTIANIEEIAPYKGQPRDWFPEDELVLLTESIKDKGQRNPITVVEVRGIPGIKYVIIDGESRWWGCIYADVKRVKIHIDMDIKSVDDLFSASLILNFHKKPHTHMEKSNALKREVEANRTISEIAIGLGKSDSWVSQYLSLQKLSPELQNLMHPEVPDDKRLRFTTALILAKVSCEHQKSIYEEMLTLKSGKERQSFVNNIVDRLPDSHMAIKRRKRTSSNIHKFVSFVDRINKEVNAVNMMPGDSLKDIISRIAPGDILEIKRRIEKCQNNLNKVNDVINLCGKKE